MNIEEKKTETELDKTNEEKAPQGTTLSDENQEDNSRTSALQGLTSNQMFSACVIAFSLGTLLMLIVAWALESLGTEFSVPIILGINIIPTMVGSLVSTLLFFRKSRVNYLINGVKIGLGGFIISYIYTSLLGLGGGGAYIMTGFLFGGILGGFIAKKIYN